jgi:ribosomal protein L17
MNHRKKGRRFNRTTEHRKMMMRNLATSLFLHGRVETTTAKAKELRTSPAGRPFHQRRRGSDQAVRGDRSALH